MKGGKNKTRKRVKRGKKTATEFFGSQWRLAAQGRKKEERLSQRVTRSEFMATRGLAGTIHQGTPPPPIHPRPLPWITAPHRTVPSPYPTFPSLQSPPLATRGGGRRTPPQRPPGGPPAARRQRPPLPPSLIIIPSARSTPSPPLLGPPMMPSDEALVATDPLRRRAPVGSHGPGPPFLTPPPPPYSRY